MPAILLSVPTSAIRTALFALSGGRSRDRFEARRAVLDARLVFGGHRSSDRRSGRDQVVRLRWRRSPRLSADLRRQSRYAEDKAVRARASDPACLALSHARSRRRRLGFSREERLADQSRQQPKTLCSAGCPETWSLDRWMARLPAYAGDFASQTRLVAESNRRDCRALEHTNNGANLRPRGSGRVPRGFGRNRFGVVPRCSEIGVGQLGRILFGSLFSISWSRGPDLNRGPADYEA